MRISELGATTGVPVATLKYYLREGLLHAGEARGATQADYDATHVRRVRLVRALTGTVGLSLQQARTILQLVDDPGDDLYETLGCAVSALPPATTEPDPDDPDPYPLAREAMERLGADRRSIRAAVGPAIAQASYEVGPEFPAPFLAETTENKRFFSPSNRDTHHMFDLGGYVESRLAALELGAVERIERDTCAEEDLFFSYRRATLRQEADYGRELSAIVIEP